MNGAQFSRVELSFSIIVVGALAVLVGGTNGLGDDTKSAIDLAGEKTRQTAQVTDGKKLFAALVNYAVFDDYPLYRDKEDPITRVVDSNAVFEILLRGGYLADKKPLYLKGSAWCQELEQDEKTAKDVRAGENDWCYVGGLNRTSARAAWTILANGFRPGTTAYVKDRLQLGGVWGGTGAVVVYCGGNAEVVETQERAGNYFVPRLDKKDADAFAPEGEWLSGKYVKTFYPLIHAR